MSVLHFYFFHFVLSKVDFSWARLELLCIQHVGLSHSEDKRYKVKTNHRGAIQIFVVYTCCITIRKRMAAISNLYIMLDCKTEMEMSYIHFLLLFISSIYFSLSEWGTKESVCVQCAWLIIGVKNDLSKIPKRFECVVGHEARARRIVAPCSV